VVNCDVEIESQRYWGHDVDILGSFDVIGHVTIRLNMVVKFNHTSILHAYGDMGPQIFRGHEMITCLEFPFLCLFTIQLLWGYGDN